jgi:hypothetical protein
MASEADRPDTHPMGPRAGVEQCMTDYPSVMISLSFQRSARLAEPWNP